MGGVGKCVVVFGMGGGVCFWCTLNVFGVLGLCLVGGLLCCSGCCDWFGFVRGLIGWFGFGVGWGLRFGCFVLGLSWWVWLVV